MGVGGDVGVDRNTVNGEVAVELRLLLIVNYLKEGIYSLTKRSVYRSAG